MDQYSYYLESTADRKERWQVCMQELMTERMKKLETATWQFYKAEKEIIQDTFYTSVWDGVEAVSRLVKMQQKGAIRYIHVSYLLNSAFTGELLVKLDFYDNNYFTDAQDVECYWNYGCLFPDYSDAIHEVEQRLVGEVFRLSPYEWQQAKLYYEVCNFIMLKDIIQDLVQTERFMQIVQTCSEPEVSILFGAYLDQAELIHKLGGV